MSPLWAERRPLVVDAEDGRPRRLRLAWERWPHKVTGVRRHWRVHLDWWTASELWRDYWEVVTDAGLCVIYHDLIAGDWVLERIYP